MDNEYILEAKGICKTFPGVKALDHVDFHIRKGEVHVLMGENGAGKSTLIKILTGVYHHDQGEIRFDGKPYAPQTALDAQKSGISTIYQEISLIPQLSVAENIFLGREMRRHGFIDWKQIRLEARKAMEKLGMDLDVTRPLKSYSTAVQQMVALARAISIHAKLLVMDEPTSSMDEDEVKVLFDVIRRLKAEGISVLFISHRLSEVFEISDTITVLKDGCLVGEYPTSSLTRLELISKMIGRDASHIMDHRIAPPAHEPEPFVDAENISSGVLLHGLNISIGKGEVVGLAGLLGSGRTEFARILFGADAMDQGVIHIDGKPVSIHVPRQAIGLGFAFCSEDRKAEGIIPHLSVRDNMMLANMKKTGHWGIISTSAQNKLTQEYIKALNIKTPNMDQAISNLSGGNQQKVLLARWLCTKPRLIILDEPTRGIDVGAKREIEELIQKIALEGISVLLISSEFDELIRNCHRVEVIRDGRNVHTLRGEEITEANIMQAIAQGTAKEERV